MPRSHAAVGGLIALAFVVAVVGFVWLAQPRQPTYFAELRDASGIDEGTSLRMRGLEVGRVTGVALTDSGVRLTLRVTRRGLALREGTRLRVRPEGIFGGYVAELLPPGDAAAPRLAPGSVLPVAPPDTLPTAQRVLAESLRAIFRRDSAGVSTTRP